MKITLFNCQAAFPDRLTRNKFLEVQLKDAFQELLKDVEVEILEIHDFPPEEKEGMPDGKKLRKWFEEAKKAFEATYNQPLVLVPYRSLGCGNEGTPVSEEVFWENPYDENISSIVRPLSGLQMDIEAVEKNAGENQFARNLLETIAQKVAEVSSSKK